MTLNELNTLADKPAVDWFQQTCAAQSWIYDMVAARPFANIKDVKDYAQTAWSKCAEKDFLEAFSAHPMIGDLDSLRKKFANTKTIASGEQSGTASASEATLRALKEANQAYLDAHGFIFIICATGLSADAMLNALQDRLPNSTDEEIRNAAREQIKITLLRIEKGLTAEDAN